MRKFDFLEAINYLLEMDTRILNEEYYYPWFMHTKGIIFSSLGWLLFLFLFAATWIFSLGSSTILPLISILFISTIIFGISYALLFRHNINEAKHKSVQQMMRLEKREFMRAIEPFVPEDQRHVVARIIKLKDFLPNEYLSVTLSTKSRILFNTDAFIKDIERMLTEKPDMFNNSEIEYSESVFKVPQRAIDHYTSKQLNDDDGTFNEIFVVPPEVRKMIMSKIHKAALGVH